jgi:hypothetical protein
MKFEKTSGRKIDTLAHQRLLHNLDGSQLKWVSKLKAEKTFVTGRVVSDVERGENALPRACCDRFYG